MYRFSVFIYKRIPKCKDFTVFLTNTDVFTTLKGTYGDSYAVQNGLNRYTLRYFFGNCNIIRIHNPNSTPA